MIILAAAANYCFSSFSSSFSFSSSSLSTFLIIGNYYLPSPFAPHGWHTLPLGRRPTAMLAEFSSNRKSKVAVVCRAKGPLHGSLKMSLMAPHISMSTSIYQPPRVVAVVGILYIAIRLLRMGNIAHLSSECKICFLCTIASTCSYRTGFQQKSCETTCARDDNRPLLNRSVFIHREAWYHFVIGENKIWIRDVSRMHCRLQSAQMFDNYVNPWSYLSWQLLSFAHWDRRQTSTDGEWNAWQEGHVWPNCQDPDECYGE